jgi:hypothetical protein
MAKKPIRTPDEQAAWDERTRLIQANIAKLDRKIADERAARERYQRRLRYFSFGLLGRS